MSEAKKQLKRKMEFVRKALDKTGYAPNEATIEYIAHDLEDIPEELDIDEYLSQPPPYPSEYKEAFTKYLNGEELNAEEKKILRSDSDSQGCGILIPHKPYDMKE